MSLLLSRAACCCQITLYTEILLLHRSRIPRYKSQRAIDKQSITLRSVSWRCGICHCWLQRYAIGFACAPSHEVRLRSASSRRISSCLCCSFCFALRALSIFFAHTAQSDPFSSMDGTCVPECGRFGRRPVWCIHFPVCLWGCGRQVWLCVPCGVLVVHRAAGISCHSGRRSCRAPKMDDTKFLPCFRCCNAALIYPRIYLCRCRFHCRLSSDRLVMLVAKPSRGRVDHPFNAESATTADNRRWWMNAAS